MKNIIKITLLTMALLIYAVIFTQAQSDRKINRLAVEAGKYVRISVSDDLFDDGDYESEEVSCGEELVTHFINKRHFIAHSSKFKFDLDVKKRDFDDYGSWLAVDRDNKDKYYVITPFGYGDGVGVIIQPVTKSFYVRHDEPIIAIANVNICQ